MNLEMSCLGPASSSSTCSVALSGPSGGPTDVAPCQRLGDRSPDPGGWEWGGLGWVGVEDVKRNKVSIRWEGQLVLVYCTT